MAGRKTLALTDRQFEVLGLLWEHGPLTVRELLHRLPRGDVLPYTTVLGLLQNMEKAGLVTHVPEKQTHRYRPLVSREEATGNLLADFLKRFFRGSAERLVLSLVDARHLSPTDLREIEAKLAPADSKAGDQSANPRPPRRKS
ncbi:MAG TPA: BlaI/MecI/CopY family transcriptional regulator [Gemmataceae bacterium]|nr:BlaI/MecI/CopY family transcriptional regulator [Gemmataceae bacterium]